MRTLLAMLMCGLATATPGFAQEPSAAAVPVQGPTFRTGVDLVTIDVGVVDARGTPVDDLRAPDFSVRIDGEPRRVVSATLVRFDAEAAKTKAAEKTETFFTTNLTPPEGRQIVLAIDQVNIRPGTLRPLLETAASFIDRLGPLDQVALMTYPEPGPRVPFTNDHLRLKLAMERLIGHQSTAPFTRLNIGVTEAIAIDEQNDRVMRDDVYRRECHRAVVPDEPDECMRDVLAEASRIAQYARETSEQSLSGLLQLLRDLAQVEGPKSLILLSEGFAVTNPADLDLVSMLAGRARASLNMLIVEANRGDGAIGEAPPSPSEDRRRQVLGLQNIAAASRGSVFHLIGQAQGVFDRLFSEMSAHYVLGVEQRPADLADDDHRVDVEVRRRNVTVRSPQAFAMSTAALRARSPQERLRSALMSPFAVAEIPLRVTTFAQQEPSGDKVRLLIAAEVGQPGSPPSPYEVAFLVVDGDNRIVSTFSQRVDLTAPSAPATEALGFTGSATVPPGVYSLRFAVADTEGRRGSVVREVNAWKMDDQELALSDLIVGNLPPAGESMRVLVEPHVTEEMLAAYVELYSTQATTFERTDVRFEVAETPDGPALAQLPAQLRAGTRDASRIAQGVMDARALPPGRYVARVRVLREGRTAGTLSRPFVLERGAPASAANTTPFVAAVPAFDRDAVLAAEFVRSMLDSVERRSPDLKDAMTAARAGRYGAAALDALGAGDQQAAAFLRGFDLFQKGQLDQAATQLQLAVGPRRDFFPAAVYLGAAFASAGRDREAAGVWQSSMGTDAYPPLVYTMAADARLRDGAPDAAIDILRPAYERLPADDDIARRLAVAYVTTGRFADALPIFDAYLARHPADAGMLFPAIAAQYELARAGQLLSDADRDKMRRYAAAYDGEQAPLIEKYLAAMGAR